jgi:hypothetical protein
MTTTANIVRLYLKKRPQLLSIVKNGLCNYSALARRLQREIFPAKKEEFTAIKAALLRLSRDSQSAGMDWEKGVEKILKASSVEIRTNVLVVSSKTGIGVPVIATSNSKSGVMSVVDSSYAKELRKKGLKVIDALTLVLPVGFAGHPGLRCCYPRCDRCRRNKRSRIHLVPHRHAHGGAEFRRGARVQHIVRADRQRMSNAVRGPFKERL